MSEPIKKPLKWKRPLQELVEYIRFHRFDIPERVWEMHSKRDITKLFWGEVENKMKSWENLVIVIIGPSGSGKSLAGLIIAKKMAEIAGVKFDIKKHVTGFHTDTATMISRAPPNTVLLQDEMTKSFGVGSRTTQWSLGNLLKTVMRYNQIHFVGIGVELIGAEIPPPVINYILITKRREMDITDPRKTRLLNLELWIKTLSSINLGDWIPIGRIILKVSKEDDIFIQEYLKAVKDPVVNAFQHEIGAPELVAQARFKQSVDSGLPLSETVGKEDSFKSVLEQLNEEKDLVQKEVRAAIAETDREADESESDYKSRDNKKKDE
ncbi:MAG: hypothetical protein E6L03_09940 [Thaumarchaeota archaeon]|nr:MAG: hypothetical protein E6L03_09940 [Nitrososphaerota archaeon]